MERTMIKGGAPLPPGATLRYGANLPHITCDNGIYALNFRLADSLPQSVLVAWKNERDCLEAKAIVEGKELSRAERDRLQKLFSERVEKYLDSGMGECWMKKPEIADLVENALKHFDGQRYELLCWCVMPNHVHVVVQPHSEYELSDIEHSWKSYTAHQANKLLNRSGVFWKPEPYDHLIRDEADLEHHIEYILANPKAAGLENWRWVSVSPNIANILNRSKSFSLSSKTIGEMPRGTGVSPVSGVSVPPVDSSSAKHLDSPALSASPDIGETTMPHETNSLNRRHPR